jgi:hypothetical protein
METNLQIDEKLFLSEMKNLWNEYGNRGAERFEPVWLKILETFNSQLSGIDGIHVCDSMCGTGKTLSAKVASAIFAKQYWNEGVIVVVRLKEQCVEVSKEINQIYQRITNTSEVVARPFFTGNVAKCKGWMSDEMIRNTQVLVVTHSRYLSHLSGKSKNELSKWQRGNRSFRIVDESLDLVERFVLSRGEIAALEYAFKNRTDFPILFKGYGHVDDPNNGKYKEYWDFFDDIQDYIGYNLTSNNETRIDPFMEIVKKYSHIDEEGNYNELYFSNLNELFSNSTKKDYYKNYCRKKGNQEWKPGEIESMMEDSINHFAALDRIIRTSVFFYNKDAEQQMATGNIILPSSFNSMVILDATSSVDKIYSLFKESTDQCHRYSIARDVRTFKNLNLHFRPENGGLGIGETKASLKKRVSEIYRWANENFRPTDKKKKVLFAGHKLLMESLQTYINGLSRKPVFDWDIIWYNNVDGKNDFKEYDNLVVTSLQYMPPHYSKTTILGFLGINGDLTDKDADGVADSTLAVKLIQLFFRIATRSVSDDEGNCPESNIYILLPGDEIRKDVEDKHEIDYEGCLSNLSKYLLKEIKSSIPDVNVCKWSNFDGYGKRGGGTKAGITTINPRKNKESMASVFTDWLVNQNLQPGESCNQSDFENVCVDAGYSFQSFCKMVGYPNKSVGRVLIQMGFERNAKQRCVTTFIKK